MWPDRHARPGGCSRRARSTSRRSRTGRNAADLSNHAGFPCLKFELNAPQYYSVQLPGDRHGTRRTATSSPRSPTGDLNGDGTKSTFTASGKIQEIPPHGFSVNRRSRPRRMSSSPHRRLVSRATAPRRPRDVGALLISNARERGSRLARRGDSAVSSAREIRRPKHCSVPLLLRGVRARLPGRLVSRAAPDLRGLDGILCRRARDLHGRARDRRSASRQARRLHARTRSRCTPISRSPSRARRVRRRRSSGSANTVYLAGGGSAALGGVGATRRARPAVRRGPRARHVPDGRHAPGRGARRRATTTTDLGGAWPRSTASTRSAPSSARCSPTSSFSRCSGRG